MQQGLIQTPPGTSHPTLCPCMSTITCRYSHAPAKPRISLRLCCPTCSVPATLAAASSSSSFRGSSPSVFGCVPGLVIHHWTPSVVQPTAVTASVGRWGCQFLLASLLGNVVFAPPLCVASHIRSSWLVHAPITKVQVTCAAHPHVDMYAFVIALANACVSLSSMFLLDITS